MLSISDLFPAPSGVDSLSDRPAIFPGITPESTAALTDVLKANHERFHIFFNERGFHNHLSHHVIALWALGAAGPRLHTASEKDEEVLQPLSDSPGHITEENFVEHLGDSKFYKAYFDFFSAQIEAKGIAGTLEHWVFSPDVNTSKGVHGSAIMLRRQFVGLVHPLIHVGYGLEFKLPGMVAEGMALSAVQGIEFGIDAVQLIPDEMYQVETWTTSLMSKLSLQTSTRTAGDVHAFTLMARMLNDDSLRSHKRAMTPEDNMTPAVLEKCTPVVLRLIEEWKFDASNSAEVDRKLKEVIWTTVLIYVAGWREGKRFHADFFLMHFITSALFLQSFLSKIPPQSKWLLLRHFLSSTLLWWAAFGSPMVDIEAFFKADIGLKHDFSDWQYIIKESVEFPDEHIPKIERALAHFSNLYGATPAGASELQGVELSGAEKIDGSLFVRAALLTIKSAREGTEERKAMSAGRGPKSANGVDVESVWYWDFIKPE